ncbi:flagellar hook-basal body protein [Herbaspirillum autotrophicum]|uniref:flagellar hook-basal body protein n=1 Tax=Herbaspirillum autotrophicum TaxID=180195 RepID=UPI00067BB952|nr:flagellar hook basal-body protein [Herbaspirillum autotrophicum]
MDEVLGVAMLSMHRDMARVNQVAMNLSNALTPAYKREVSTAAVPGAQAFGSLWDAGMAASMTGATGTAATQSQLDMSAGTLKSTGQPLDLALASSGFFEVQTEKGPAYTRQGNFRLDQRGRIVTAQGYPLMGKGGEIQLNTAQPAIDVYGNITDKQKPVAQIKVVQFEHAERLQRIGEGLYAEGSEMRQLPDAEVQLRQGFLENANVSSAREMMELMQAMRHFESMQKVTQGYDDMIGSAIRKLGEM